MRTETITRTLALFEELSPERQEAEIEKFSGNDRNLACFFDVAGEAYGDGMHDVERECEKPESLVSFNRDNLDYRSSGQGWYYDHCEPHDFLKPKDTAFAGKNYVVTLDGVDASIGNKYRSYSEARRIDFSFEWNVRVETENGGTFEVFYSSLEEIIEKFANANMPLPPVIRGRIQAYENRYKKQFTSCIREIEKIITEYDTYYPENNEIRDYLIATETEFVISGQAV